MKECKYCKEQINKKAKICSHCGKKQKNNVLLIVIFIIALIAIIGGISGLGSEEAKEEKFSYEITKEYNDSLNFGHYIEGVVTNNLEKDYAYVQIEFICYDENGNNLGTAIDNTNNLLANQTWKFKALGMFTNEKVDHCDYKEITGW